MTFPATNTDPTDADFAARLDAFDETPDPKPPGAPELPPAKTGKKAAAPAAEAPAEDEPDPAPAEGDDPDPDVEVPEDEDPAPAEGDEPAPAEDELARLRAENEELRAKATAAPAAPAANNFEVATIAELDKERAAALADLETIESHIDEDKDYTDPTTGEVIKTLAELKKLKRANEKWLRDTYPTARAAAEKAATERAAATAAARTQYPTQFKPGTPAAAKRAEVAAQYADFARHPQFDLLISEVTTARLLKPAPRAPAAPAPVRPAPQGSPTRRPGPAGAAPAPVRDAWARTKGKDGQVDEAAQADVLARL